MALVWYALNAQCAQRRNHSVDRNAAAVPAMLAEKERNHVKL